MQENKRVLLRALEEPDVTALQKAKNIMAASIAQHGLSPDAVLEQRKDTL